MSSPPHAASAEGGKTPPAKWPRMKWTDASVRLLISLAGADLSAPCGGGGSAKGKWKAVSDQMLSRGGFCASPQQCEDKLSDLNKRFKRLADLLGPAAVSAAAAAGAFSDPSPLLADAAESLPSLSSRAAALKLLSSKQLFFAEMAALHSGHQLPLPPHRAASASATSEDDAEADEEDADDMRTLRLRAELVEIEAEALELERRRLRWDRFRARKDRELERWRLEHERMWLENERMRMLLRIQQMDAGILGNS